jgi:hypothetical protein
MAARGCAHKHVFLENDFQVGLKPAEINRFSRFFMLDTRYKLLIYNDFKK